MRRRLPVVRRGRKRAGIALARALVLAALAFALSAPTAALASVPLVEVSSDHLGDATGQHRSQVEPDTFSWGSTIVAAFQVGRTFDGGAGAIGWAVSTDAGAIWTDGLLPGLTSATDGRYDRASDPVVAYDAAHDVWMIASLAILDGGEPAPNHVIVSRSTDGGHSWDEPIVIDAHGGFNDKSWVVCDTGPSSPYYGRCYAEWDDNRAGNLILMSTSSDGGLSWSEPAATANLARGLGGQPVVQPDGTVIVPAGDAGLTSVLAYRSTDGGQTWSESVTVAAIQHHRTAGGLRAPVLPAADVDAAGRVYVVWSDCRFRIDCSANDIVMSTSADGLTWTEVSRVPITPASSRADYFTPGIAAKSGNVGESAQLALVYYYYADAKCRTATCRLHVGYISSADGGASWDEALHLAGPMIISWLPATSQGRMFGDYISVSFVGEVALPVVPIAKPPGGGTLDVGMYAPAGGLEVAALSLGTGVRCPGCHALHRAENGAGVTKGL